MKEKVVREGLIDISTGKRLGKKKVIKIKGEEKSKTRWPVSYTHLRAHET